MTDVAEAQAAPATEASAEEFALVEIMGFRKLAGRIMEAERFGAKLLRIDIPTKGDFANGFTSQYYSGASIFSITPTDLATVCSHNKPYEPARLYSRPAEPADDAGAGLDDDQPF